jgi:hypothetical protein
MRKERKHPANPTFGFTEAATAKARQSFYMNKQEAVRVSMPKHSLRDFMDFMFQMLTMGMRKWKVLQGVFAIAI